MQLNDMQKIGSILKEYLHVNSRKDSKMILTSEYIIMPIMAISMHSHFKFYLMKFCCLKINYIYKRRSKFKSLRSEHCSEKKISREKR